MRDKLSILAAATLALALAGCGDGEPRGAGAAPTLAIQPIASPAPPGSGESNLAVGPDGFYLSWLERTDSGTHALRIARWADGVWDEPRTVMDRPGLFVNWADFPSVIVLDDGALAAHWLEKSGPGTYSYDVRMAVSRDGGATWSEDVVPHRDGLEAEHGFVSLFPDDGGIGAVWLDGRETVEGRPMTLRATRVATDATAGPDMLLDDDVCECCQTGAAVTADGPAVVYRAKTPDQIRDIYITRRVDGRWTEPRPVHDDGWRIDACPVNGPAIDAAGERVVVAWFTGAPEGGGAARPGEPARVLAAFSDDAGARFGPPVRIDDGAPMGRVDVVLLDDGSAVVSWVERTGEGDAEIRIRRAHDTGVDAATALATTAASRPSGFPRMVRDGDRLLFSWTEVGEAPVVRTALATLGGESPGGGSRDAADADRDDAPRPAPDYAAATLDGESVSLRDLRGDVVLLNVWATWCAPCRREIPELEALHREHRSAGLRVIGVTVDSRTEEAAIRRFMDEFGMTFEIWWDPDQRVLSDFEAMGVPITVLIDREGMVRWSHLGALIPGDPELRRVLDRLLPVAAGDGAGRGDGAGAGTAAGAGA